MSINIRPSTKDIYLAAAYIALGALYDGADKSNPKQMIFYFKPPEQTEEDAQPFDFEKVERLWVNGILLVNAKSYAQALRDLKSVVHSN